MDTFERVRSVVAQALNLSEEQITPQTSLIGDLVADSLDVEEITMILEETFDVAFGDEPLPLNTIQQIVDYIERKLGEQPRTKCRERWSW